MILGWSIVGGLFILGILCWSIKDKEYDEWKNDKHK
jgi:nitrogen fixation-related uncharacterized protein